MILNLHFGFRVVVEPAGSRLFDSHSFAFRVSRWSCECGESTGSLTRSRVEGRHNLDPVSSPNRPGCRLRWCFLGLGCPRPQIPSGQAPMLRKLWSRSHQTWLTQRSHNGISIVGAHAHIVPLHLKLSYSLWHWPQIYFASAPCWRQATAPIGRYPRDIVSPYRCAAIAIVLVQSRQRWSSRSGVPLWSLTPFVPEINKVQRGQDKMDIRWFGFTGYSYKHWVISLFQNVINQVAKCWKEMRFWWKICFPSKN